MKTRVLFIAVLIGMCGNGWGGEGAAIFGNYQAIVQSETNAPAAMEKGKQYLVSLSRDDFMAFIRETKSHAEYDRDDGDAVFVMVFFAKWYKEGPGRNEPMLTTLTQLSDLTVPSSWKIGLLDVLKPEKCMDLTEEDVAAVKSGLVEAGMSKQSSDMLRAHSLQKLGNLLYTQRELMMQKFPKLKGALEKQDRTALPKGDGADVKRAGELIDAFHDYKAKLLKTAEEVNDDQIKINLKKSLLKWEAGNVATPIKAP